jgi:hypothetical protein
MFAELPLDNLKGRQIRGRRRLLGFLRPPSPQAIRPIVSPRLMVL